MERSRNGETFPSTTAMPTASYRQDGEEVLRFSCGASEVELLFGKGWSGGDIFGSGPQRRKRAWWDVCSVWMLRGNIVWKEREAWRGDVWRLLSYGFFTRLPLLLHSPCPCTRANGNKIMVNS